MAQIINIFRDVIPSQLCYMFWESYLLVGYKSKPAASQRSSLSSKETGGTRLTLQRGGEATEGVGVLLFESPSWMLKSA